MFAPLGHSPDVDLVAELGGRMCRVQVKTSTQRTATPDGHERHPVMIPTNGGNQSWTGITKRFNPSRFDFLFVLTGTGRRWFIPVGEIEARNCIQLGGPKYSEFEVELSAPIDPLVYGAGKRALDSPPQGEYPRGQRTAAVNRQAQPSQVRLLPPPSAASIKRVGRGPAGTTCIGPSRKVTLPSAKLGRAGLAIGDRLHVAVLREGTLILTRIVLPDP